MPKSVLCAPAHPWYTVRGSKHQLTFFNKEARHASKGCMSLFGFLS